MKTVRSALRLTRTLSPRMLALNNVKTLAQKKRSILSVVLAVFALSSSSFAVPISTQGDNQRIISEADITLGSPFQDGMVLQRGKPVKVWGATSRHAKVSLVINGVRAVTTSDANGQWLAELPALSSGGPYELVVTDENHSKTLSDVLVGDVWFAFGQSNMVFTLSGMDGRQAIINDITSNDLPIRCLKVKQQAATSEQQEGEMVWLDNRNPNGWSAVGAVFAYRMYQATGVPTAIIWSAWGSTSIEAWMPLEMTEQFPYFARAMDTYYADDEARVIAMLNGARKYNEVYVRTRPNIVYNQMVHPLLDYGIAGFLWYQGEANAGRESQYAETLPAFVTEYRKRFGQGDLPFLGVQLPSYKSGSWPWFREAQNQLETLPNAYVAVTIDTGKYNNIHPRDKEPIGTRLSLLARKYVYGESIEAHGPRFDSMSINGDTVTIRFIHASGLKTNDSHAPTNFQLAGRDQVFHDATSASIQGADVILRSTSVPTPVAVRYAWSAAPASSLNLINRNQLPAAPFRTDTWARSARGAKAP